MAQSLPPFDRTMTRKEVAEWLGMSAQTIGKVTANGELPVTKVGADDRYWYPTLIEQLFPEYHEVPPRDGEEGWVIDVPELASRLQVSGTAVRNKIAAGEIPAARLGRAFRVYWPIIRHRLQRGLPLDGGPTS